MIKKNKTNRRCLNRISKKSIPNDEIRRPGRIYKTVDTIESKQLLRYRHVMTMAEEK